MSAGTAVRERPVLFSGSMVRGILEDRKTNTRRVVKPQPTGRPVVVDVRRDVEDLLGMTFTPGPDARPLWAMWMTDQRDEQGQYIEHGHPCPYGRPGDRLWVRENFRGHCGAIVRGGAPDGYELSFAYAAGGYSGVHRVGRETYNRYIGDPARGWRPSIHMPRWVSRITLEITDVRVERVQEISEEDARAEGVSVLPLQSEDDPSAWWQTGPGENQSRTARGAFSKLWDSLNAPRGFGWSANPWVWAIAFRRLEATHG